MGTEAASARGKMHLATDILRRDTGLDDPVHGFIQSVLGWTPATQGDVSGALEVAGRELAIGVGANAQNDKA